MDNKVETHKSEASLDDLYVWGKSFTIFCGMHFVISSLTYPQGLICRSHF